MNGQDSATTAQRQGQIENIARNVIDLRLVSARLDHIAHAAQNPPAETTHEAPDGNRFRHTAPNGFENPLDAVEPGRLSIEVGNRHSNQSGRAEAADSGDTVSEQQPEHL